MTGGIIIKCFLGFWEVFSHSFQPIATNGASYESPQSQDRTYTLFCTFGYLQLSIYLLTYMGVFGLWFVQVFAETKALIPT